jgi:DNA-binding transcriptional LysR family regulator
MIGTLLCSSRTEAEAWFRSREAKSVYRSDGKFRKANAGQVQAAAMQHLGVAHVPFWVFQTEIEAGTARRPSKKVAVSKGMYDT